MPTMQRFRTRISHLTRSCVAATAVICLLATSLGGCTIGRRYDHDTGPIELTVRPMDKDGIQEQLRRSAYPGPGYRYANPSRPSEVSGTITYFMRAAKHTLRLLDTVALTDPTPLLDVLPDRSTYDILYTLRSLADPRSTLDDGTITKLKQLFDAQYDRKSGAYLQDVNAATINNPNGSADAGSDSGVQSIADTTVQRTPDLLNTYLIVESSELLGLEHQPIRTWLTSYADDALAHLDETDPHGTLLYELMDLEHMHPADRFRPVLDMYVSELKRVAGRIEADESMTIGLTAYGAVRLMERLGVDVTPYRETIRRALLNDDGSLRDDLFELYSPERMYYAYYALCAVDQDCAAVPGVRKAIDDDDHYLYDDETYGRILSYNDPGAIDTQDADQLITALQLKDYVGIDQFLQDYHDRLDLQSYSLVPYLTLLQRHGKMDIVDDRCDEIADRLRSLVTDSMGSDDTAPESLWQLWQARHLYDAFGVDWTNQTRLHTIATKRWSTGQPRYDLLYAVCQLGAADVLHLTRSEVDRLVERVIDRFYDYQSSSDVESRMQLESMTVTALQEHDVVIPSTMLLLINQDVDRMSTDTGLFRSGLSDADSITFESTANALTIKETITNQLTRRTS